MPESAGIAIGIGAVRARSTVIWVSGAADCAWASSGMAAMPAPSTMERRPSGKKLSFIIKLRLWKLCPVDGRGNERGQRSVPSWLEVNLEGVGLTKETLGQRDRVALWVQRGTAGTLGKGDAAGALAGLDDLHVADRASPVGDDL